MKVLVSIGHADMSAADEVIKLLEAALEVDHELICVRGGREFGRVDCAQEMEWFVHPRPDPGSEHKASPEQVRSALRSAAPRVEQVAGVTARQGESTTFMLDPLEQAIQCTAQVMRGEQAAMAEMSLALNGDVPSGLVYKRMGCHLDELLAAQLRRVTANE